MTTLDSRSQNLGSRSSVLHPMLIPLIMYGTDVTQPAHEYLVEVALILW